MYSPISALDTAPVSITSKALAQNFNLEEKTRREEATKNRDFYYGKQDQDVVLANEDVEAVVLNLTKPIMVKRCNMLYSRPLFREFVGNASSVAFIEKVYKENSIDALLQKVDLLSELTGSCLVHPLADESFDSGVRLVLYDATTFSAAGNDNDPATADALSLLRIVDRVVDLNPLNPGGGNPQVERVVEQQVWTLTTVSYYTGSTTAPTLQSSFTHDLGYLPFVNFRGEEVHDQYIGFPQANIVRTLNKTINQMLTNLGYMIKMQAASPIAFTGFKSGESVVIHPGQAIALPAGATAEVLDLNPKIKEALEAIVWLEDRLYVTSSVPKISVEGGEGQSGRELLIRWFPLLQVFQEKTVRWTRYELTLANMILALNGMEPIEEVKIDWPEENILPFSPDEDNIERDLRLNLTTVPQVLMNRDPQLDEAEAERQFLENATLNTEIQDEPQGTRRPSNAEPKP